MPHAMRFHKPGGPEVLSWEEVEVGKPGPGEALLRQTAVGLNFVETYIRSGLYPAALPSGLGTEGGDPVLRGPVKQGMGLDRTRQMIPLSKQNGI